MSPARRLGMCGRCGRGWVGLVQVIWAAGTLCAWLCARCELATRAERQERKGLTA